MDESEMKRRVTQDIRELGESFEMNLCAYWSTEEASEIYFIDSDPSSDSVATLERLSESFRE